MNKITLILALKNSLSSLGLSLPALKLALSTIPSLDLIVVDSSSTNDELNFINSFRLVCNIIQTPPLGVYNAYNIGAKAADPSSYLMFLGSDDIVSCQSLSSIVNKNLLLIDKLNIYPCLTQRSSGSFVHYNNTFSPLMIGLYNSIHHQGTLIHRTLLESVGFFDENLSILSDYALFVELSRFGLIKYHDIPFPLSISMYGGISNSRGSSKTISRESMILSRKYMRPFLFTHGIFERLHLLFYQQFLPKFYPKFL